MSDRKADILRKVRALLAKADSTPYDGEAQVFRQKADELMTAYAIEVWQLETGAVDDRTPIKSLVDLDWWYKASDMIDSQLWSLFWSVYTHNRCVIVVEKHGVEKGRAVPVVGLPADLDYSDMLFTSLMVDLMKQIDPYPDPNGDYHEQLRRMRDAGLNWHEVVARMQKAGFGTDETPAKAYHTMSHDYRRWCKRTGTPQNYAHWKTWRRNFSTGYVSKVADRLFEMRQRTNASAGNGMELALRDIRQVVKDAVLEMYPDLARPRPAVRGRTRAVAKRNDHKVDFVARGAGQRAGENADLSGRTGKMRKTPELDS